MNARPCRAATGVELQRTAESLATLTLKAFALQIPANHTERVWPFDETRVHPDEKRQSQDVGHSDQWRYVTVTLSRHLMPLRCSHSSDVCCNPMPAQLLMFKQISVLCTFVWITNAVSSHRICERAVEICVQQRVLHPKWSPAEICRRFLHTVRNNAFPLWTHWSFLSMSCVLFLSLSPNGAEDSMEKRLALNEFDQSLCCHVRDKRCWSIIPFRTSSNANSHIFRSHNALHHGACNQMAWTWFSRSNSACSQPACPLVLQREAPAATTDHCKVAVEEIC